MGNEAFETGPKVVLPNERASLLVEGDGLQVEFQNGNVIVHSGNVKLPGQQQGSGNTASLAGMKIGEVVQEGHDKGWI